MLYNFCEKNKQLQVMEWNYLNNIRALNSPLLYGSCLYSVEITFANYLYKAASELAWNNIVSMLDRARFLWLKNESGIRSQSQYHEVGMLAW